MKTLLRSAVRGGRYYTLIFVTFFSLLMLTVANQMEMFTLGIVSSKGADFFTLFEEKKTPQEEQFVSLESLKDQWEKIDREKKGVITRSDANRFLATKKTGNPLQSFLFSVEARFGISEKSIESIALLIVLVAIVKAGALFFSRFCTQLLAIRVSRDLREAYFKHIQSLPMSFYHKHNIGALSARVVGDASQIAVSFNAWMNNYLHAPFTIISSLIACFCLSWQLSLVIFVGIPLVFIPVLFVTKKVKKITRLLQKNQERFSSVLIDYLSGVQTVKIFGMEAFSLKKYKEQNDQMAHLEARTAKYDLLTRPILHTVTTFCLAIVLIFGLHILKMNVSQLFVFCGLLYLFYEPVKKFAEENAIIQKGVVAAERMNEVLELSPHITDSPDAAALNSFTSELAFKDVWFKYDERWILKGVSFSVKKGETVGIVGTTGAGKSTIVQLIPRLYDVQKGEITIDGRPLKQITLRSLREQVAFVSQKPFLFYDTVAANIAFGRAYKADEIVLAAKKAHAHEFIEKLPEAYMTMLEETGKNFSGGQQQRLAIARALIKKAPILILDEATSALDTVSEGKIKAAIEELRGSVTQIIIAHRLSTIEHADRIIVLEEGCKIAEGTKDELLQTCPQFALMWEAQFSKEKKVSDTAEALF